MPLFPAFLKLAGRRCLVVGAGALGEAKVEGLLQAGAVLRIVAPEATPRVRQWARDGRLEWEARPFEPRDLEGVFLVVAAVPGGEVLSRVFEEASRRGVLCNAVDDPLHCDFYYAAVVRRGDFQIAVSTGGQSPALAQRVRKELEAQYGPEYERWVEELGRARETLLGRRDRRGPDAPDSGSSQSPVRSADVLIPDATNHERLRRQLHVMASREAFTQWRERTVSQAPGRVFLVGAGPGDPDLLTVKARRLLAEADVVLHDALVPASILDLIRADAVVQSVGKRHQQPHITQDAIHELLIAHARAGRMVVRLKGGDVAIFARASEEGRALRQAGVAFEMVPGVTAAAAAAAAAGVSLTDRASSSTVVLATGQTCRGNARPDWRALADLEGTLAIYMPGQRYEYLAMELLAAGIDPSTPCLIVSHASQPSESVAETTVGQLSTQVRLPTPAILLIGETVAERSAESSSPPVGAATESRD